MASGTRFGTPPQENNRTVSVVLIPLTGKKLLRITDHLSVGAWADSAYEYLLKEYLLTGQSDKRLLNMCW